MRKTKRTDNWFVLGFRIDKQLRDRGKRIEKQVRLLDHVIVVLLSLSAGVIIFFYINTFFLPETLPLPETTAINWLVLNEHSMTLDYIRFGLFVLIISISIVTGWIMVIWKKNR